MKSLSEQVLDNIKSLKINEKNIFKDFTLINHAKDISFFDNQKIHYRNNAKSDKTNRNIEVIVVDDSILKGLRVYKIMNGNKIYSAKRPVQDLKLAIKKANDEIDNFLYYDED